MNLVAASEMVSNGRVITIGKLFEGIDCKFTQKEAEIEINGLADDSRMVKKGNLFFAIPGFSVDGRKFVPEAISLGAKAIACESNDLDVIDVPIIRCRNIKRTLAVVSAKYYGYPSLKMPVVGVTGTNGKTTTTYLLSHIMSCNGKPWARIGTIEYFTGKNTISAINTTPNSLLLQRLLAEACESNLVGCAMEVSSHGLEMGRCDEISFAGGVFTNLTQDHLDYHKTMENYFSAKSVLFEKLIKPDGFAILNADDPYYTRLKNISRAMVLSYSLLPDSGADFVIQDGGQNDGICNFILSHEGKNIKGEMPLIGKFNLQNAVAAVAAACRLGIDLGSAVEALASAPQVPGRVQKISMGQPFTVIVDYAHTPDALKNLLTNLEPENEKLLVFGCGGDRDRAKRPLMGQIAVQNADRVIVTSDNPRTEDPAKIIADIVKGMSGAKNYFVLENRDQAIGQAINMAKPGDIVIIAGKGHEEYQIIGKNKHYFSDQEVARKYLKKLGYAAS